MFTFLDLRTYFVIVSLKVCKMLHVLSILKLFILECS